MRERECVGGQWGKEVRREEKRRNACSTSEYNSTEHIAHIKMTILEYLLPSK